MYRIYILSKSNVDDIHYELYDCITSRFIVGTKDRYEFKLKLGLMGINGGSFKIVNYSVYKNCAGSYTASIVMSKRND